MNEIATCQGKTVSCNFEILSYTRHALYYLQFKYCKPYFLSWAFYFCHFCENDRLAKIKLHKYVWHFTHEIRYINGSLMNIKCHSTLYRNHKIKALQTKDVVYTYYTPHNDVRGGILESPCTSVRPSVCLSVCRRARLGKMVLCA